MNLRLLFCCAGHKRAAAQVLVLFREPGDKFPGDAVPVRWVVAEAVTKMSAARGNRITGFRIGTPFNNNGSRRPCNPHGDCDP